jgi:hypothetical protein
LNAVRAGAAEHARAWLLLTVALALHVAGEARGDRP